MSEDDSIPDEAYGEALLALLNAGINFLAIDFDQTIVTIHTGGRFKGPASALAQEMRPMFKKFLPMLYGQGISIGVVTFSGQVDLIRDVLKITFPTFAREIAIRGRDGSWIPLQSLDIKDGKQKYIASAATELISSTGKDITRASTLLVDDDDKNIDIALINDVRAIWLDIRNPQKVIYDIKDYIK